MTPLFIIVSSYLPFAIKDALLNLIISIIMDVNPFSRPSLFFSLIFHSLNFLCLCEQLACRLDQALDPFQGPANSRRRNVGITSHINGT